MKPENSAELSYEIQKQHHAFDADEAAKIARELQGGKVTVDLWRHHRLASLAVPIIQSFPEATWVTIGDGKWGWDAHYLTTQGVKTITATDITEERLKAAKEVGYIPEYSVENAEKLSFPDASFDFAFVKDCASHCPRGYVVLYEMLRVARLGIVVVEPYDPRIPLVQNSVLFIQRFFYKLIKRNPDTFNQSANYVFTFSEREIEKMALGLHLQAVAFRHVNDHNTKNPAEYAESYSTEAAGYKSFMKQIRLRNMLTRIGLNPWGRVGAVILKEHNPAAQRALEAAGFIYKVLPRNPYLKGKTEKLTSLP